MPVPKTLSWNVVIGFQGSDGGGEVVMMKWCCVDEKVDVDGCGLAELAYLLRARYRRDWCGGCVVRMKVLDVGGRALLGSWTCQAEEGQDEGGKQ